MVESLILPLVRGVVGKAGDALVQRITRMWAIDGDRRKLERRLLAVQRVLAVAEVKSENDPAVKTWMKDLKAVAYKADDVLDQFQYEALRREVLTSRPKTEKVLSQLTRDNPLLFRFKVSRELKKVLEKIDELVDGMNKFHLVENAVAPQTIYRETHSGLDKSEQIHGRDDEKALVVKLLLDQQDQQNVQVLPIIGMGGLGKTTLAKMVYNDSSVQNHFELKMWYCVSDNFEPTVLVRSIIQLATKDSCHLPDNIELLWGGLQEVIGRKRFLLILDDVWNEEQRKWEDNLKPLLCSSIGGSGCVIVVTSRSQRVASIMGTLPPHDLACLSENDSMKLFTQKAFSKQVQEREELVKISRQIVKKCKGLPLALKTMGGLMSSKEDVEEWHTIANTDISDTDGGKDQILPILKMSYKYLPDEMKQCFAFCALFPKDSGIEKDKLIQLWMANGFILEAGTMDLTAKGEFIFQELSWRSFLQDVKINRLFGTQKIVTVCQMHDLMHDLATDATEECASTQKLIREKITPRDIRHIDMVMSFYKLQEFHGLLKNTSSVRTLLTCRLTYKELIKEIRPLSLRALRCTGLTNSLVKHSKCLRYLDLSGSVMVRLPDSLCMLYHLQSLRLNGCRYLQYLPDGMAISLRKLSHIYLLECKELEQMPPKLSLLRNLRTLTRFVVGTKDGCGIEELKELRQLGNTLELRKLKNVKSGSQANLHEKKINELLLDWDQTDILPTNEVHKAEEVLDALVPPSELNILHVRNYHGRAIPQWMRDPQMIWYLSELRISGCPRCTDIPTVWLSPFLQTLDLDDMDNLTTLCKNIDVEAVGSNSSPQIFPKLKRMSLMVLPKLETWAEDSAGEPHSSVTFPHLEELKVFRCRKLVTLPMAPLLTSLSYYHTDICADDVVPVSVPLDYLPSLVSLNLELLANVDISFEGEQGQKPNPLEALRRIHTWGDNGFVSIFNVPKLQVRLGDALAFVEELEISSCRNIVHWPLEELQYLPLLRSLNISKCDILQEMGSSIEVGEFLPLPRLEILRIGYCRSLHEIPLLPASLEEIGIESCPRLEALPSNFGNLTKLRLVTLRICRELQWQLDGMDGLTSLEKLAIGSCPGIQDFPQGILQRLPALRSLTLSGTLDLQRRCSEGGEYFDLVSSIPEKYIPVPAEPKIKKQWKQFLPFCGGCSQ